MKTTEDLQQEFKVSKATIRNWMKTGILKSPLNEIAYTEEEFISVKETIFQKEEKLRSRANRFKNDSTETHYLAIKDKPRRKLLEHCIKIGTESNATVEELLFFLGSHFLTSSGLIRNQFPEKPKNPLEGFIFQWANELNICRSDKNPFASIQYIHEDDDLLGAFYQSVTNTSDKSKTGSYFTPAKYVQDIKIDANESVLDPCCGSGGLFLKILSKNHTKNKVFAYDIDNLALKICAINLSMFFQCSRMEFTLCNKNILYNLDESKGMLWSDLSEMTYFDNIITNPPWGSKMSLKEKSKLKMIYPELQSSESFAIAFYNCFNLLNDKGQLVIFLPHAFLNVGTHKSIRKFILQKRRKIQINLLGNAFPGVVSEVIRMIVEKGKVSSHIEVCQGRDIDKLYYDQIDHEHYIFQATAKSEELHILDKIYQTEHFSLKGKAQFALGIVTGNNSKHIKKEKINGLYEPIYRGKDIHPFTLGNPECYIEFVPERYQQVANPEFYRREKLVYRFISDKLICALDASGSLILNSANLFFVTVPYPSTTIACLMNSKLYTFIYRKKFHSKKVLKSHIEALPFPILTEMHHELFSELYGSLKDRSATIEQLNSEVYKLFQLNESDIDIIERGI